VKFVLARAAPWIAALWWGSLGCIGFLVVPLLFAHLPSPALAGNMAAKLFAAQTWVSVVCALLLLLNDRENRSPDHVQQAQSALLLITLGMLLALLSELAVAPRIVAREKLWFWHSLGSGLYVVQWVCAGWVFRTLLRASARP